MDITPITKMSRDIKKAALTLSAQEARYLVDSYYAIQDYRIASEAQIRSMRDSSEPHEVLTWYADQNRLLEAQIKGALGKYAEGQPIGEWLLPQIGIGPVIAAGLMSHINIHKAKSAGAIWQYAGIDGKTEWLGTEKAKRLVTEYTERHGGFNNEMQYALCLHINRKRESYLTWVLRVKCNGDESKLEKNITKTTFTSWVALCPHNKGFKTLCWKMGESFVKVSGNEKAFYGQLYAKRKAEEIERNLAGLNAEAAAKKLATVNLGKDTIAYKAYAEGKLPDAHIHARAKRYTVKIFLAHLHEVWREIEGYPRIEPYAIEHLGHKDYIPPHWAA